MRIIVLPVVVSLLLASALPAFAQPAGGDDKEVRIVGCVQLEKDHSRKHEFVLTMVKPEGARKATEYGITGDRAKELGRRVGQEIEVIGVIESEGTHDDLPQIKMNAWVPVKDSCQAP